MIDHTKQCALCDGDGKTPSAAYIEWHNVPAEDQEEFDKNHPVKICEQWRWETILPRRR